MIRAHRFLVGALLTALAFAPPLLAVDVDDTLMLAQPAISESHVSFSYANDLWVAERGDGPLRAHKLTSHGGREFSSAFSPDGQWVAFTATSIVTFPFPSYFFILSGYHVRAIPSSR